VSLCRRPLAVVQNCWGDEIYQDDCRSIRLIMSALTGSPLPEEGSAAADAYPPARRTDQGARRQTAIHQFIHCWGDDSAVQWCPDRLLSAVI